MGVRAFLVNGKGRMMNLSADGAYVATPMYLLPQARVKLQIVLKEEKRWVETDAVMVWENRGTVGRRDGLPPGYGFRFVDVPGDAREAIQSLMKGAPAAAHGTAHPSVEQTVAFAPPAPSPPRPVAAPATTPPVSSGSPPSPPPATAPTTVPPEPIVRTVSMAPMIDDEPEGPPYRLRKAKVENVIPAATPGIFVLSYDRTQETLVGRSDVDLRETIVAFEGTYAYFYFEAIDEQDERYYRECELFHRLGGDRGQLDNTDHPTPPEGLEVDCPVCVASRVR